MSISSCYDAIGRYNALKASLANVVNSLNSSQAKLSPVSNLVYSAYSVDENETPVVGRIKGISQDIASTSSYITNVVIPAIDRAITQKRNEANRLETELANQMKQV